MGKTVVKDQSPAMRRLSSRCGLGWLVLFLSVCLVGCERSGSGTPKPTNGAGTRDSAAGASSQTPVSIEVEVRLEFAGQREAVAGTVKLPAEGTAFDALSQLAEQQGLAVESRGEGATLFVMAVGGIANGGPGKPNWIYRVDGKLGDRSAGVYVLGPGQKLVWSLGDYPDPKNP